MREVGMGGDWWDGMFSLLIFYWGSPSLFSWR